MKNVTVNVPIQFDVDEANMLEVHAALSTINSALSSLNLFSSPQILSNALDSSDCEFYSDEDED